MAPIATEAWRIASLGRRTTHGAASRDLIFEVMGSDACNGGRADRYTEKLPTCFGRGRFLELPAVDTYSVRSNATRKGRLSTPEHSPTSGDSGRTRNGQFNLASRNAVQALALMDLRDGNGNQ